MTSALQLQTTMAVQGQPILAVRMQASSTERTFVAMPPKPLPSPLEVARHREKIRRERYLPAERKRGASLHLQAKRCFRQRTQPDTSYRLHVYGALITEPATLWHCITLQYLQPGKAHIKHPVFAVSEAKCLICGEIGHPDATDSPFGLCDGCDKGGHYQCFAEATPDPDSPWFCPDCKQRPKQPMIALQVSANMHVMCLNHASLAAILVD